MAIDTIFLAIGAIIILGFLSNLIFSKTNVPDVFWLIAIGIFIGPVMNIVSPDAFGNAAMIFTYFALLFILFEGGLHIRIKDLMRSMYGATTITLVNFVLSVIVITFIARFFGWSLVNSLLLGTILGGTSSAVVVPIVKKLQMSKNNSLVLILESAFTDVLCIVATLTIIQIVNLNSISLGGVLNSLFGSFAIAIFIGGIIGFFWILLLEKFSSLSRSYISTIGVLMMVFGLTEFSGASGAIAGLTFGIVMGNARKILSLAEGEEEEADTLTSSARAFFAQISFFVKTFFFVYIGVLTSLAEWRLIALGIAIAIAVFIIRPVSVKLAYKPQDNPEDKPIMESMIPKGLAAAVLAQIPMQYGIPNGEQILTPVFSAIFFTIALTTILVFLVKRGKYHGLSAIFANAANAIMKKKSDTEIISNFKKNAAKAQLPKKKKGKATKKAPKKPAKKRNSGRKR